MMLRIQCFFSFYYWLCSLERMNGTCFSLWKGYRPDAIWRTWCVFTSGQITQITTVNPQLSCSTPNVCEKENLLLNFCIPWDYNIPGSSLVVVSRSLKEPHSSVTKYKLHENTQQSYVSRKKLVLYFWKLTYFGMKYVYQLNNFSKYFVKILTDGSGRE